MPCRTSQHHGMLDRQSETVSEMTKKVFLLINTRHESESLQMISFFFASLECSRFFTALSFWAPCLAALLKFPESSIHSPHFNQKTRTAYIRARDASRRRHSIKNVTPTAPTGTRRHQLPAKDTPASPLSAMGRGKDSSMAIAGRVVAIDNEVGRHSVKLERRQVIFHSRDAGRWLANIDRLNPRNSIMCLHTVQTQVRTCSTNQSRNNEGGLSATRPKNRQGASKLWLL
jgi:hypothetical protein